MRKYVLAIMCLFLGGVHIASAQDRQISGTVTSAEDGSTYPGVTVMVPGTTIGAITNLDGNYTITVPDDATELEFKYVGMKTVMVSIEGRSYLLSEPAAVR